MGFKSAKNTRNVNNSDVDYEVDGIIFPSRFVFTTTESIDRNLKFLYTPGSEDNDFETINHSPVRDNDEEFDAILSRVEKRIGRITGIDDTKQFIFKEKHYAFFEKFGGIVNCFIEGVHSTPKKQI